MTSILLRAPKSPFVPATVERTLSENLIGNNSGNLVFIGAAWKLLATREAEITAAGMGGYPARAAEFSERHDVYVAPLADAFRLGLGGEPRALDVLHRAADDPRRDPRRRRHRESVNFSPDQLKPIEPIVKRFVRAVLDHGPTHRRSRRDDGDVSRRAGVQGRRGHRLPVDVHARGSARVSRSASPPSIATAGSPSTSGTAWHSPYLAKLGAFIDRQVPRYPHLTHFGQDRSTLELLVDGVVRPEDAATAPDADPSVASAASARTRALLHRAVALDRGPGASSTSSFGTRIHGNIAALIAGTPAFVLAHDARTLELARYFEIPHRAVPDLAAGHRCGRPVRGGRLRAARGGHAERWERFAALP